MGKRAMKRILILIAISLFLCSTASAFQGGGSTKRKQGGRGKTSVSKPSTIKTPIGNERSVNSSSLPIKLLRSLKITNFPFLRSNVVSPDGKLLAVGDGYINGTYDNAIGLYDLQTGLLTHRLIGHTRQIASIAFSPDSSMVISGSHEFIRTNELRGEARLWDTRTGKLLQVFRGSTGPLIAIFSPDGENVVAWYRGSSEVRLWDVHSGELLWELNGQGEEVDDVVDDVVFSLDRRVLWCLSSETIHVWELQSRQLARTFKKNGKESFNTFSPDSKLFATTSGVAFGNNVIRVSDAQTGESLITIDASIGYPRGGVDPGGWPGLVLFSPDGQRIIAFGEDIRIWNVQTGKLERKIKIPAGIMTEGSGGRLLSDGKTYVDVDPNGIVRWWDIGKIEPGASVGIAG